MGLIARESISVRSRNMRGTSKPVCQSCTLCTQPAGATSLLLQGWPRWWAPGRLLCTLPPVIGTFTFIIDSNKSFARNRRKPARVPRHLHCFLAQPNRKQLIRPPADCIAHSVPPSACTWQAAIHQHVVMQASGTKFLLSFSRGHRCAI